MSIFVRLKKSTGASSPKSKDVSSHSHVQSNRPSSAQQQQRAQPEAGINTPLYERFASRNTGMGSNMASDVGPPPPPPPKTSTGSAIAISRPMTLGKSDVDDGNAGLGSGYASVHERAATSPETSREYRGRGPYGANGPYSKYASSSTVGIGYTNYEDAQASMSMSSLHASSNAHINGTGSPYGNLNLNGQRIQQKASRTSTIPTPGSPPPTSSAFNLNYPSADAAQRASRVSLHEDFHHAASGSSSNAFYAQTQASGSRAEMNANSNLNLNSQANGRRRLPPASAPPPTTSLPNLPIAPAPRVGLTSGHGRGVVKKEEDEFEDVEEEDVPEEDDHAVGAGRGQRATLPSPPLSPERHGLAATRGKMRPQTQTQNTAPMPSIGNNAASSSRNSAAMGGGAAKPFTDARGLGSESSSFSSPSASISLSFRPLTTQPSELSLAVSTHTTATTTTTNSNTTMGTSLQTKSTTSLPLSQAGVLQPVSEAANSNTSLDLNATRSPMFSTGVRSQTPQTRSIPTSPTAAYTTTTTTTMNVPSSEPSSPTGSSPFSARRKKYSPFAAFAGKGDDDPAAQLSAATSPALSPTSPLFSNSSSLQFQSQPQSPATGSSRTTMATTTIPAYPHSPVVNRDVNGNEAAQDLEYTTEFSSSASSRVIATSLRSAQDSALRKSSLTHDVAAPPVLSPKSALTSVSPATSSLSTRVQSSSLANASTSGRVLGIESPSRLPSASVFPSTSSYRDLGLSQRQKTPSFAFDDGDEIVSSVESEEEETIKGRRNQKAISSHYLTPEGGHGFNLGLTDSSSRRGSQYTDQAELPESPQPRLLSDRLESSSDHLNHSLADSPSKSRSSLPLPSPARSTSSQLHDTDSGADFDENSNENMTRLTKQRKGHGDEVHSANAGGKRALTKKGTIVDTYEKPHVVLAQRPPMPTPPTSRDGVRPGSDEYRQDRRGTRTSDYANGTLGGRKGDNHLGPTSASNDNGVGTGASAGVGTGTGSGSGYGARPSSSAAEMATAALRRHDPAHIHSHSHSHHSGYDPSSLSAKGHDALRSTIPGSEQQHSYIRDNSIDTTAHEIGGHSAKDADKYGYYEDGHVLQYQQQPDDHREDQRPSDMGASSRFGLSFSSSSKQRARSPNPQSGHMHGYQSRQLPSPPLHTASPTEVASAKFKVGSSSSSRRSPTDDFSHYETNDGLRDSGSASHSHNLPPTAPLKPRKSIGALRLKKPGSANGNRQVNGEEQQVRQNQTSPTPTSPSAMSSGGSSAIDISTGDLMPTDADPFAKGAIDLSASRGKHDVETDGHHWDKAENHPDGKANGHIRGGLTSNGSAPVQEELREIKAQPPVNPPTPITPDELARARKKEQRQARDERHGVSRSPEDHARGRERRTAEKSRKEPPASVVDLVAKSEQMRRDQEELMQKQREQEQAEAEERERVKNRPPTFYPILAHVTNANLLQNLLQYFTFRDWCVFTEVNDAMRRAMEHNRDLRETALERFLDTVGYARWKWTSVRKEPIMLTFRDLNAYMRGVSIPSHQFAVTSRAYLDSKDPGGSNDRYLSVQKTLLASSCRAYTRVVLRLRVQAEGEIATYMAERSSRPSPLQSSSSVNVSQPKPPPSASRPPSRAPSPTGSHAGRSTSRGPPPTTHHHHRRTSSSVFSGPGGPVNGHAGPPSAHHGSAPRFPQFRSILYRPGHSPLLRVFVPTSEGDWLSDENILDCEKELKRGGVVGLLKAGDVIWDAAAGDEGNTGRLIWDGNYLIDLDFTYSEGGDIPYYLHSLSFPPSYFHRVVRTSGNPICYVDLSPWAEEIAANLQLLQDRVRTETPQGGHHMVVRWIHRSKFHIVPSKSSQNPNASRSIPIPNTSLSVDPAWFGTVVVEAEGTNEGLADLQDRCRGAFPERAGANRKKSKPTHRVFRLLRERSRPGEIWIRTVREKERLVPPS